MVAKFLASIDAAYTAVNAGDYSTALRHARAARIAMSAIPKSELDRERIELTREGLDSMIDDLQRQANATTNNGRPFQEMPIVYTTH